MSKRAKFQIVYGPLGKYLYDGLNANVFKLHFKFPAQRLMEIFVVVVAFCFWFLNIFITFFFVSVEFNFYE